MSIKTRELKSRFADGMPKNLPKTWDLGGMMTKIDKPRLVRLDTCYDNPEYTKVADMFSKTMDDKKANIVAIRRVQNIVLWEDFEK